MKASWLYCLLGFAVASAIAYWRFIQQKHQYLKTQIELETSLKNLEQEYKRSADMQNALGDTFKVLSQKALESNHSVFMQMAQSSLEKVLLKAEGKLNQKEDSIAHLVQPIQDMLKKVEEQNQKLEETRQKTYGGLEEQLRFLLESNRELKKETGNLVSALKKPQVRGRWGEMTLKRVAELAGLIEHCDFYEQTTVNRGEGLLRPDMMVHLPDNRKIVVDAKVPLQAYLEALEAESDEEKEQCLRRHAQHVVHHMRRLAKKSYWDQFEESLDFVVMFIPGESFFSVAVEFEKNLIEDGIHQKVIISTPTTLIALLRAVSYGWRQEQLTHNAQEISQLGAELYERLAKFVDHYSKVGRSLEKATDAFNQSVASLESRVLVSVRKFKDLGISSKSDVDNVAQLEKRPKSLVSSETEESDALLESSSSV